MKDMNYFIQRKLPRLTSIKNLSEEKTVASNHREGGIQIENMALSKGSLVSFIFLLKRERNLKAQL